jgi:ABC-type multidrug transport system ATPase subunit
LFRSLQKGSKPEEPDRKLLENVWGEVPQQQTTAIMGPSGAGKTSLLNILAGRAASRGRVTIDSDVRLNNFAVDPKDMKVRKHIAFVAQDDSLQVTSTPREAIYFSAKLRLPRDTPERNLEKLVTKMIKELGLIHCADTYVGGALVKGISGGERKRTSVGVELVVKPAMVFLDEPTSGLDSFSAVQLCQVLKKVANAGASVLFTIHQPASEIFNSFDRLILMNKGRVMYQGAVTEVPSFFAQRGHACPTNYNPADWIMNVAQSIPEDQLNQAGFFPKDTRPIEAPFKGDEAEGRDALGITLTDRHASGRYDDSPVGMGTQVQMLFTRELKNIARDTASIGARFGLTIFLSILVGIIFLNVGKSDSAIISVRVISFFFFWGSHKTNVLVLRDEIKEDGWFLEFSFASRVFVLSWLLTTPGMLWFVSFSSSLLE